MLIILLARDVLSDARPAEKAHLLRVEETEIHRLANVAVGFLPRFADFEDFDRAELKAAPLHKRGHAVEQFCSMLDRGATPMVESVASRLDRALRFRNPGLGHHAHGLVRPARIKGRHPFAGRDFLAVDRERVFFAETSAHLAQRGFHLLLRLAMNEIDHRGVLVGVARRSVDRETVCRMILARRRLARGQRSALDQFVRFAQ